MLDKYDKVAVLALLIRQIRAQDINAREKAVRDAAIKAVKETDDIQATIREALKAFGFDPKAANMWDQVKEAVGADIVSKAFAVARGKTPEVVVQKGSEEDEDNDEEVSSESEDADDNDSESDHQLNIRELVLDRLTAAGGAGTEAAPIKAYVEKTLNASIHAKTVGMTLWRLSKAGLARREGRTWFRVNDQETLGANAENEEAPAAEAEEAH